MLFSSCTSALYEPKLKEVKDEKELAELKAGRKTYVQKCSSCHTLYLPENYTDSEWTYWLNDMGKRIKISDHEKSLMYKYLTYRK